MTIKIQAAHASSIQNVRRGAAMFYDSWKTDNRLLPSPECTMHSTACLNAAPCFLIAALTLAAAAPDQPAPIPDVLFIPTPIDIVDRMLELAKVRKDDVVYDLGCGDGRILVRAV